MKQKFGLKYEIAVLTEKTFESPAPLIRNKILKTLVRNATSAILEVAEIALCPPLLSGGHNDFKTNSINIRINRAC